MAIDIERIKERIRIEKERQRETQMWYEHRRTWAPVLTEQQKQEFDEYSKKWNLPF